MSNGVTREHDSYSDQNIKQADVNLLAYPLQLITDKEQIARDLKFYETKIPHSDTPAMTQAIFSLLYSRLGDSDQAYHWFKDAYQPNLNPPSGSLQNVRAEQILILQQVPAVFCRQL